MKTSGHLLLYISENEDFELWRVLSQISPEERAAFVKAALKKALLPGNDARNPSTSWARQNNVFRMDKSAAESPLDELALEELGYSSLAATEEKVIKPFIAFSNEGKSNQKDIFSIGTMQDTPVEPDNLPQLQIDDLLQASQPTDKSMLPGLDFLLNNVIGEEDDEKVIEFIRNNRTASGENS
ncbi:MAG: hypothetical protein GX434_01320 [Peptococcaceae bacterium]|nr:hypothetical protein [Peptococcaceae bacterium]